MKQYILRTAAPGRVVGGERDGGVVGGARDGDEIERDPRAKL